MRKCPICDAPASSRHHIKPRSQGGTDNEHNIMWLCPQCHNEVELAGIPITPETIIDLRRKKKGAEVVSHETYWYLWRDDGLIFLGIKYPGKPLIHYDILFPYDSQLELRLSAEKYKGTKNLDVSKINKPFSISKHKGRPKKIIPAALLPILHGDITEAEKVKATGLSRTTIYRRRKENATSDF